MCDKLWDLGYSPVKIDSLNSYLKLYGNKPDAELLLSGFTEGFRLQYKGPRFSFISRNLLSALALRDDTLKLLQKEVELGRMEGPFNKAPISTLRTSPIGLVEKADHTWRMITHMSYPENLGVNSFIDEIDSSVQYSSFDNVIELVASLGKGTLLGKIDIRHAFRLFPINPADFDLLGITYENKFYIDKNLPFGCSISCALIEKFAKFLHWVISYKAGLQTLDHYLDDFIFAGEQETNDCQKLMDTFVQVADELGVPIAHNKTVAPTTNMTFLGLDIDTVRMVVKIPDDKLSKLRHGILYIIGRQKIYLRELQSIVGLMAFCARAIPAARAFLRRFYDLFSSVKKRKPYYYIRITKEVKLDAQVWLVFLDKFNGECYLTEKYWLSSEKIELFTDSSGNPKLGCGAYFSGKWVQMKWPEHWSCKNFMLELSFLELFPVLLALYTWWQHFQNQKLLMRIDNEALACIINKRTSKSKNIIKFIRPLVLITMTHNIHFRSVHIPGCKNGICDALSRFQFQRFQDLAPLAEKTPADIPVEFSEIISEMK